MTVSSSPQPPIRLLVVINRPDLVTAIVRALQYAPHFDADPRFDAVFASRYPTWLVRLVHWWPQRKSLRWIVNGLEHAVLYFKDRTILRMALSRDLVYAITTSSAPLQKALQQSGTPVVMDVVDALWLPWFRQFGWDDLEHMLATADGVICENEYTAEYVRRYGNHVHVVPDSPQLEAFDRRRADIKRRDDTIVLGWIGGKDSVDSLYAIYEPLEELFKKHAGSRLHLRILGAPADRLPRFEYVTISVMPSYDQQQMIEEALRMHIGLFPQFKVEESLNRGSLKAKIYMSAEAATVCQNLGENQKLIVDGSNGLLAADAAQWFEKLDWLVSDPEARLRLAAAGLQTIRDRFTAAACYRRLAEALEAIHARGVARASDSNR